jgi:leader peptidase (prepilin peptidase)/N-methyltransferase
MQYPLVEAGTAILFALIGVWATPVLDHPGIWPLISVYLIIIALLVAITAYDMLHTIIPDGWAYSFAALALFVAFVFPLYPIPYTLYVLCAGPLAALPLFLLWLISSGRWMGLGDAKLALGIGWLLGPIAGIVAVMFSFIIGTALLIPLMLVERAITHMRGYSRPARGLTMKSEVPFGPFLILSCVIFWFAQLYGVLLPLPF